MNGADFFTSPVSDSVKSVLLYVRTTSSAFFPACALRCHRCRSARLGRSAPPPLPPPTPLEGRSRSRTRHLTTNPNPRQRSPVRMRMWTTCRRLRSDRASPRRPNRLPRLRLRPRRPLMWQPSSRRSMRHKPQTPIPITPSPAVTPALRQPCYTPHCGDCCAPNLPHTPVLLRSVKKQLNAHVKTLARMVNSDWHDGYEEQGEECLEWVASCGALVESALRVGVAFGCGHELGHAVLMCAAALP